MAAQATAVPPNLKADWIQYEESVRCPPVNGRRIGLRDARRELNREWAAMTLAERMECGQALQLALEYDEDYETLRLPAMDALGEALTTRDLPEFNEVADGFFEECRLALPLVRNWHVSCANARNEWRRLRTCYERVPANNQTPGQIASLAQTATRIRIADNMVALIAGHITQLEQWLLRDPIYYQDPGPGPPFKVKERHVPEERRSALNPNMTRNFAAEGVTGGNWRAIAADQMEGAGGVAYVWFRQDGNNRIVERLVRKEVMIRDLHDARVMKGNMPWELECHRLANMEESGDADRLGGFVRLRSTLPADVIRWVNRVTKSYRVYMHWYPNGDLNGIIRTHGLFPVPDGAPPPPIPEPMIWSVAESLIRSGKRMAAMAATNNGNQLVHRDLKPGNVFLGPPDATHYPQYPQAYVGDFGAGLMTSLTDAKNPDWYTGDSYGTAGFRAPEMIRFVDSTTLQPIEAYPLLEHTNVWQVGAILRSLVLLDTEPSESVFLDWANDTSYVVNVPGSDQSATYSANLLQMIDDMMAYTWTARPTFAALAIRIANLPDVSRGMRAGTATTADRNRFRLQPRLPVDSYALGLAAPP